MKKILFNILLIISIAAHNTVYSQSNSEVEKEIKELAATFLRKWSDRNIDGWMACFGKIEGAIVLGGKAYSLDSLKRIIPNTVWANRKDESWIIEKVIVLPLPKNTAFMQIEFSGSYTYIPTGDKWVFDKSAYVTSLVRKAGGKWKMVAHHNSIEGTLLPK